jgi:ABC-type glycerol-3-phosphate transport system permease component
MPTLTDLPLLIFVISLAALWLCAWLGANVLGRHAVRGEEAREEFSLVLAASLTLLGLIIGFSFSMSISRYDQRKSYEESEANAIGTEYLRVQLLPQQSAQRAQQLLRAYLQQRVLYYNIHDPQQLSGIEAHTLQLQNELWAVVRDTANAQPNAVSALTIAGMNDVLNSQSYTQAAWWNRIPVAAWVLMALIAMLCNVMVGYAASRLRARFALLFMLPLIVSIAFYLIADIDSPRGGMVHVRPQNLLSLAASLR